MDLIAQLTALFSGPWGAVAGAVLVILYQLARSKWPALPALPLAPNPAPSPDPALPSPGPAAPSFPILRALLDAFLKSQGGKPPADLSTLPADQLAALWSEVDALVDLKAKRHEAELAELK